MSADGRSALGLAQPYHNPHLAEAVREAACRRGWRLRGIAFASPPGFRKENDWAGEKPIAAGTPSGWLACLRWLVASDRYIFLGFGDPFPCQPLLVLAACLTGRPVFVASEGLKRREPSLGLRILCAMLSHLGGGQLLAIGNTAAEDYAKAGLAWPARRFGFTESPPGAAAERKEAHPERPVRLLVVGQLIPRKRVDWLQEALARHPASRRTELWVCGTGPDREMLETRARELGLSVRYLGFCRGQELAAAFNEADIFIHPAAYEGWGVVLNHALHFGLPILAADSVRSARGLLVQQGLNGYVFGDEAEFSARLAELVGDPVLRGRLALRSRQMAADWSVASMGARLAGLLADPEAAFAPDKPLSLLYPNK